MQDSLRPWPSPLGGARFLKICNKVRSVKRPKSISSEIWPDWARGWPFGDSKEEVQRDRFNLSWSKDAKTHKENLIKNDLKSLARSMLWSYISNVHKLWVLIVVFQDRMDHSDYYFDSLTAEFKSWSPRLKKCPLYPSLSRIGQASPSTSANRGILPTIFFLITTQEKTGLLILDLSPATKEMPRIVLIGRRIKLPHIPAHAMGEIHWELLDSAYQGKSSSVISRETKSKWKLGKIIPSCFPLWR